MIKKAFEWKNIQGYYIYAHFVEETQELLYIGKGKRYRAVDTSNRNVYWKHIYDRYQIYCEILRDGLTESEAFILEKLNIIAAKQMGFCRTNIANGGEGPSGYKASEETKEQHRLRHKQGKYKNAYFKKGHLYYGNPSKLKGKKQTQEHKNKVSEALKGKSKPKGFGEHLSKQMKGASRYQLYKKLRVTYPNGNIQEFESKKAFVQLYGHRFQIVGRKIKKGIFKNYTFEYLT